MSISLLSSLSVPYSNLYSILVNKSGQQDEIVVSRGGFKLNSWLSKGVGVCAPFVIGGFSGMLATVVIQPLDAMKVQIQIAS